MTTVKISPPKSIILDIEGTTTPIDFVHKILFGYIRKRLQQGWLREHWLDEDVVECRNLLNFENRPGDIAPEDQALKQVEDLMDKDIKSLGLKKLQALIMIEGYTDGSIKSVIFEDAQTKIKSWKEAGYSIYIYSSGSVSAQKLLFTYTQNGDLTSYIDGYFDTTVGSKVISSSYMSILSQINCRAEEALFLSDNIKEIAAASSASLPSLLVVRPGNVPVSDEEMDEIKRIYTFEDIIFVDE